MIAAQPLGAFPLPAGFMLVPDVEDLAVEEAVASLLAGKRPAVWPDALRAHELVHQGEIAAADAALASDDPITLYNRYVLWPERVDSAQVEAALPTELAPLVAVLRYATGESDDPPVMPADVSLSPVVQALIVSTQATHELASEHPEAAVELLHEAAELVKEVSPPLAALLRGNAGTILQEHGLDAARARADLTAATKALTDTDLNLAKAELHYQLGVLEHEEAVARGMPLRPAMHQYYTTLQLVTETSAPYLWASAQLNLATAHLSAPMIEASDQLRHGVAIQALRAALRIFDREEHPAQWATATLNLANALVYAPSLKHADNLVEAVELYEEVLETRGRDSDPLGRARVLANQGNTLAHLGIFDHAKAKLYEARFLFEEHLDHDAAMTVRSVLDEIAKQLVPEAGEVATGRLAMGGINEETMREQAQEGEGS